MCIETEMPVSQPCWHQWDLPLIFTTQLWVLLAEIDLQTHAKTFWVKGQLSGKKSSRIIKFMDCLLCFYQRLQKKEKIREAHKPEPTGITNGRWAVLLAPVVKYFPGHLLEEHMFVSSALHGLCFPCNNWYL